MLAISNAGALAILISLTVLGAVLSFILIASTVYKPTPRRFRRPGSLFEP